jgi:hypothetical protein
MTRTELLKLAREAGFYIRRDVDERIISADHELGYYERFAALVAAHEREACATVFEQMWELGAGPIECAAAIRAQGERQL